MGHNLDWLRASQEGPADIGNSDLQGGGRAKMGQEGKFSLNTILYHLNIVIHACLKHFIINGLPIYVL